MGKLFVCLVLCTVFGASLGKFPLVPDPRDSSLPRASEIYRLPNDTKPISYEIWLEPEFEEFTFEGSVVITIRVEEETDVITLHADNLTLDTAHLFRENEELTITETQYDGEFHFLQFLLDEPVQPEEELTLSIKYSGNLQSNRRGFYRAAYDEGEETK